jgi:hypothetical protein
VIMLLSKPMNTTEDRAYTHVISHSQDRRAAPEDQAGAGAGAAAMVPGRMRTVFTPITMSAMKAR